MVQISGRSDAELATLRDEMAGLQTTRQQIDSSVQNLRGDLEAAKSRLENSKSYQAALQADLRCRASQAKIAKLEQEIDNIDRLLGELPTSQQLDKSLKKLRRSVEKRHEVRWHSGQWGAGGFTIHTKSDCFVLVYS